MNDLELLRQYEPIARFTEGELFFPMAVDEYVKSSSLWITDPNGQESLIASEGELDLQSLPSLDSGARGHVVHLRFISEPLAGIRYRVWLARKKVKFSASARMARVPLISRLVDSFFNLSLAVRGKVPGGTAAAADLKCRRLSALDPRRVYYARVVRDGGWVVLHYLYFYAMNNWRSGFNGVNDHEADWEQAMVYLYESDDGGLEPEWVAYTSHEFAGDNLRRRWDDPRLTKAGTHPVLYIGAGSHAGYFEQGEYVMGAAPQFLAPMKDRVERARRYWGRGLSMIDSSIEDELSVFQVPFVDYARGDGLCIGAGGDEQWNPVVISEKEGWVRGYQGLWGLDTHDPIEGERAPSGPKFNRDGSVRLSWLSPLGWAGLDKLYPPSDLVGQIDERISDVEKEIHELDAAAQKTRTELRALALEVGALESEGRYGSPHSKRMMKLEPLEKQLHQMQLRRDGFSQMKVSLQGYLKRAKHGEWGKPDAHLRHSARPEPPIQKRSRVVELWAAVSATFILLGIVGLLVLQPQNWPAWVLGFALGIGAIEAVTRRWIVRYIRFLTLVLALISGFVLLVEFWQLVLVLIIGGLALFVLRENLAELRNT